jgi:hypothetical protein
VCFCSAHAGFVRMEFGAGMVQNSYIGKDLGAKIGLANVSK